MILISYTSNKKSLFGGETLENELSLSVQCAIPRARELVKLGNKDVTIHVLGIGIGSYDYKETYWDKLEELLKDKPPLTNADIWI